MDMRHQDIVALIIVSGAVGMSVGGLAGLQAQYRNDQTDVNNIPGRVLDGTTPIPHVSKEKLAEIAADKPEAWDRLQEMKRWVAEVEALAAKQRADKNSAWQKRLNGRAPRSDDLALPPGNPR